MYRGFNFFLLLSKHYSQISHECIANMLCSLALTYINFAQSVIKHHYKNPLQIIVHGQ